jgi:ferrous iron transport protein B
MAEMPAKATRPLEVALAGNPNTGKTTLFNALTGARAHVGNYPGITVERRVGTHDAHGHSWRVTDLPGSYSLSAHSPEEEIAHHALTGQMGDPIPEVVIVVVDATNIARNLLLLLQIAEIGRPVLVALNMMDAAAKEGVDIDVAVLQRELGCPVVPMIAARGEGLEALGAAVAAVAADPQRGQIAETAWPAAVSEAIARARDVLAKFPPRQVADQNEQPNGNVLWWLSTDPEIASAEVPGLGAALLHAVPRPRDPTEDPRRLATVARFARIDAILSRCVQRRVVATSGSSERVDRVLLHPAFGALLFILAMTALFQAVFAGAQPAVDLVEAGMGWVSDLARTWLPDNLLRDVLIDGVLAGVSGTLVFLPQILMLFLGISLLEDSGYLARTAYLVDQLMARIGLPGKAFVPLLSAFSCAVPAVMATRTMPDRRDRLLTIMVAPLMSCSARLPVYTLVTAAVFAHQKPVLGIFSLGGLVVTAMYALGFLIAILSAFVLRRTAIKGGGAPLLLEMPPYRWPRLKNVVRSLGDRAWVFVTQTGTIIVLLTVILWGLMTFPRHDVKAQDAVVATAAPSEQQRAVATQIARAESQQQLHDSFAGHIGRAIEPIILPLGFDWRIGIGLVGSFAAREVLVPIMGQVFGRGSQADIDDKYAADVGKTMAGAGALTPLKGLSLMVFFAIAMQCLSTLATIRRETNSWRWPIFAVVYMNGLAWLCSFTVYQIGRSMGYA